METGLAGQDLRKALGTVDRNRPLLERSSSGVYREVDGVELRAYIFTPTGWSPRDQRPALLFFHGSLWDKGLVSQFAPQALYFAERGLVTILFEYRLHGNHGVEAMAALEDVAEAHRWTAGLAGDLGVDPRRLMLAGASAGAWMAMVRALSLAAKKPEERDMPPPAALVLFEPICEIETRSPWAPRFSDWKALKKMVPRKMIGKGVPPAMIFHGSADPVVPYAPTVKLAKVWKGKSKETRFVPYEGAGHGFYNFNVDMRLYENTLNAMDDFLVSLGFLEPGEAVVAL